MWVNASNHWAKRIVRRGSAYDPSVKQSLHRTWLALGVAALAVLVVAGLVGRDFVRDVYPECPGALRLDEPFDASESTRRLDQVDVIDPKGDPGVTRLRLRFDAKPLKGYFSGTEYSNVRILRSEVEKDGRECECGKVMLLKTPETIGVDPTDLRVFRDRASGLYVVKNGNDVVATIRATREPQRMFQRDRVFAMRNLACVVVLFGLGALGVALFRSRRAMAYAFRFHGWTEATLTSQGHIENESGGLLANVDSSMSSTRRRWPVPVGDVLVDPKALSASSLYREMPIVSRSSILEGGHSRWLTMTMVQLRDARALAVISTLCTAAAYAARVLGV